MQDRPTGPVVADPARNQLLYFLSGASLYGLMLAAITFMPWYVNRLSRPMRYDVFPEGVAPAMRAVFEVLGPSPHQFFWRAYAVFLGVTLVRALWASSPVDLGSHRPTMFWWSLGRFLQHRMAFVRGRAEAIFEPFAITSWERTNILYFCVKMFFSPLMIGFLYGNVFLLFNAFNGLMIHWANPDSQIQYAFFVLLYSIFVVDVGFFCFGYLFELKSKSYVRSVEPTAFGWLVALMCYPPLLDITNAAFGWGSQDFTTYGDRPITIVALSFVLINYAIYGWATVALGFRGSNLTNRGIVWWGPYRFVRHPAYICKNLAWITLGIPVVASRPWAAASLALWAFLYYLRALTEEAHLMRDPEYQAYCAKVRYRFLPGVY